MGGAPARAVGISLWLAPGGASRERLARLIADLGRRLGTPVFEPHVTLLAGLTLDESRVRASSRDLARRIPPLPLVFDGLDGTDEYFRALFAPVRETVEMLAAHERAREAFGRQAESPFRPHLSLAYGQLPPATRESLAAELGADMPEGLVAERLEVVRTEGPPGDWRRLDSLKLGPGAR